MVLTKEGKVIGDDEVVLVDSDMGLEECFVIRVLRDKGCNASKELAAEFECDEFPSEGQIMYCIAKAGGTMADVRKRYKMVKNGDKPYEWWI